MSCKHCELVKRRREERGKKEFLEERGSMTQEEHIDFIKQECIKLLEKYKYPSEVRFDRVTCYGGCRLQLTIYFSIKGVRYYVWSYYHENITTSKQFIKEIRKVIREVKKKNKAKETK